MVSKQQTLRAFLGIAFTVTLSLVGCALAGFDTVPQKKIREHRPETKIILEDLDTSQRNNENEEGGKMSAVALQVDEKILFDFTSENKSGRWMIVNDGVMGGLSQSELQLSDQNTVIFQGELSLENYGGFASVRTVPYRFDLAEYDGLSLRVLGDGRSYKLRLRTDTNMDGPAYEVEFDTTANVWLTVYIPFQDAIPTFRGRRLTNLPTLSGQQITQIGLMLADKQSGSFRLEVDWVRAYRTLI